MKETMTRRTFGKLLAGTALSCDWMSHGTLWPRGPIAADSDGRTIFPYGTHVYREPHLPLDQFRHDFPILKKLGFNMIKIQEVWAYDESQEGNIDLSNVAQVVSDARQNGLRVYFGVTMENAPAWFWKKYPDATMVYENGQPHNDPTQFVLPTDGKPGPCWHHPKALEFGTRFVESVGREIGKYDNIEIWNVFQEIAFWYERPGHLGVCYCNYTIAAFRKWLKTRYASLKELNVAWETAYGEWEEIEPPRMFPKVPPMIDWRYFMDDEYLSYSCRWKADAFRRSDPLHRPILAHVGGITMGGAREWRYAKEVDVFGSSCYPAWWPVHAWDSTHGSAEKPMTEANQANHEVNHVLMYFDYLRSSKADGNIWAGELQGGPLTEGLNRRRVPSPADIRRWALSCVAAGARGLCYWNHRPEIFWHEGYGFSLLDWGSDSSERATEAGRVAEALNRHADLFAKGVVPKSSIGIVVDEDLFHFAQASQQDVLEQLEYTIVGNWKSFWHLGISTDFVALPSFPKDADDYKVLLMPFPLALSPTLIEKMKTYVSNGGVLIAEACPGRFSNYGMAIPGAMAPGISELFGVAHDGVFLIREPNHGAKWTIVDLGPRDQRDFQILEGVGPLANQSVFPAFYLQTLTMNGASPILRYGKEVAGSVHEFGQGKAYLIGTLLGHAGPAYDDWRNADFLSAVAGKAGVKPDRPGRLRRRRRILNDHQAWFFFNERDSLVQETIDLEGNRRAEDLFGGELPLHGGTISVEVDPLDVRCVLVRS